jgi:hypothetical protein
VQLLWSATALSEFLTLHAEGGAGSRPFNLLACSRLVRLGRERGQGIGTEAPTTRVGGVLLDAQRVSSADFGAMAGPMDTPTTRNSFLILVRAIRRRKLTRSLLCKLMEVLTPRKPLELPMLLAPCTEKARHLF